MGWSTQREMVFAILLAAGGCNPAAGDNPGGDAHQGSDPGDSDSRPSEPPAPPDCEDPGPTSNPMRLGRVNTIELVTWNLHNFPATTSTVARLAALVKEFDVDLVTVEEIADSGAFTALLTELPSYSGLLSPDDYSDGSYQKTGYLFRNSVMTLVDSTSLFGNDYYVFPRPPFQARFDVLRCSGAVQRVVAIAVHLKADFDADSVARRKSAVSMLKSYVDALVAQGSTAIVVLGDFNDSVSDATSDNIFTPFLDDSADYTVATEGIDDGDEYTYIPSTSFLDHLVFSQGLIDESVTGNTRVIHLDDLVTTYSYEVHISDHLPVISILPR